MLKVPCLMLCVCLTLRPSLLMGQPEGRHDLLSDRLAPAWDEGIPLGNGMLGALIWLNEGRLRVSLDRADLWDERPMKGLHRPEFTYRWVADQVTKSDYGIVQRYFDAPYEAEPAPTKIPGAALEFDIRGFGIVDSVRLSLRDARCVIEWKGGIRGEFFVHATSPSGWFRFRHVNGEFRPSLVPPAYRGSADSGGGGSVEGDHLSRLGYAQGLVERTENGLRYRQTGWGGFSYDVSVRWHSPSPGTVEGTWSISSRTEGKTYREPAEKVTTASLARGFENDFRSHRRWWRHFWSRSSIRLPEPLLEKQWFLEQYKFGSASRRGAPPISLQAVWTADNGRIPPWKGDYHHDLNTQLSYWPCYSGNHLEEGLAYLDHLDGNKETYRRYTRLYFGSEGLAVPGVTALDGTEMGGWIQYSCSPTIAAWLAQHFDLHWRYSMDTVFLRSRAYPWLRETAIFFEHVTVRDSLGKRKLPISSSPEINNNDVTAWFTRTTNFDLALMKYVAGAAERMARALRLTGDANRWHALGSDFPDLAVSPAGELMVAPGYPWQVSHRHFSHAMAIHPLGLTRWEDGEESRTIIRSTVAQMEATGPKDWCGYSYAWLASMKARMRDGEGAARALSIFARAFCTSNSFHVNGDQTRSGLSGYTYRPFTLEGNFAFAAGVQEMLLQSHSGVIEVFPSVPAGWRNASFTTLRGEGAFLVSARRHEGRTVSVTIRSERGGDARIRLTSPDLRVSATGGATTRISGDILLARFRPGGLVRLESGPGSHK
jgi:alpha-L-fucosidase 2